MSAIKRVWRRLKKFNYANIAVYITLILISYQFIYPLLRMLMTSLMSSRDVIDPTVNWIPKTWTFDNIRVAFNVLGIGRPLVDANGVLTNTLFNSLWWSVLLAFSQTLVTSLTGFAFARYHFKFKNFWFMMVIVSFILPTPIILIPRMMMFQTIQTTFGAQMIGTVIPQLVLALTGQGVYSAILVLIFYNFTRMIPKALDEAASIDGASPAQVFYHVILKLSVTTLLVVFLFSFVWNWNETYITGTFLRDKVALMPNRLNMFTDLFAQYVQGGAHALSPEQNRINEAYKMSGTLLSIVPLFVIYLVVQRHFIKGIENAGITGE